MLTEANQPEIYKEVHNMSSPNNNKFDVFDTTEIYSAIARKDGEKDLTNAMVSIGMKFGLTAEDATINAEAIIRHADRYERNCESVESGAIQAVNSLQDRLEAREGDTAEIFRQIYFGFDMTHDEALLEELKKKGGEQVYKEYCGEHGKYANMSQAELRDGLIRKVSAMNLSPKALKRMTRQLSGSLDYTASAAALGRDGHELKCLAAMYMYSTRPELDARHAATLACVGTDIQAVADAVHLGDIGAKVATGILIVKLIGFMFTAAELLVLVTSLSELFITFGVIALISYFYGWLFDNLPEIAGELTIAGAHLIHKGVDAAKDGIEKIRQYIETPEYLNDDGDFDFTYDPDDDDDPTTVSSMF